jgi:hypothetical protein
MLLLQVGKLGLKKEKVIAAPRETEVSNQLASTTSNNALLLRYCSSTLSVGRLIIHVFRSAMKRLFNIQNCKQYH